MRLREQDMVAIKSAAEEVFGTQAIVRLFGSRVDDDLRGGDIDLHIQADEHDLTERNKARFRRLLAQGLGERSIDTIFMPHGAPASGIHAAALSEGICL